MLVNTTRTIPKCDRIIRALIKESSKILRYNNEVQLIWVERQIKDLPCSINSISDDNNTFDIQDLNSLINSTFNQKQFYLSGSDISCMMDCFG